MESLDALKQDPDHGSGVLAAPKLGVFRCALAAGDRVRGGTPLGTIRVLNKLYRVVAPAGTAGIVERIPATREIAVGYGEALIALGAYGGAEDAAASATGTDAASSASGVDGTPIVAPIAGIFYRRASPTAPNYVEVGQAVAAGQTVGLIEVMKTFNPVVHTGPAGVVVATPAGDRQEVTAGQALVVVR